MSRWDRYRIRRPTRSQLVESTITTALVALVVVSFVTLLHNVLSTP
ncbi:MULTISPECIES: hypothetical protein [unclassified Streptomyces]